VQITISARHGNMGAETQDRIREKADRLRRLYERVTAVIVTVDLEHRESPTVEVRVSVEHREDLVASETSGDVISALDLVLPKVEQQLRRHKEKKTDRRAPGGKHWELPVEMEPESE
jgi:putative sigma-54 modulation protein